MLRDPYARDKFTREIQTAPQVVRDYLGRYPKDRYETEVESWADIQCLQHRICNEAVAGTKGILKAYWAIAFHRTRSTRPPMATGRPRRLNPRSWAPHRELIELAKTMDLEAITKKTGRKPEAILTTARRLGIKIKGRQATR